MKIVATVRRQVALAILGMISVLLTSLVAAETATGQPAQKPNVLLICVDDLRPELGCYGVSYIHSPNIDRLAASGRVFRHNYVQAPTCGASRYTLLTGRYGPPGNDALFQRAAMLRAERRWLPQFEGKTLRPTPVISIPKNVRRVEVPLDPALAIANRFGRLASGR